LTTVAAEIGSLSIDKFSAITNKIQGPMLLPAEDAHPDRLDQGEREEEIRAFLRISCVAGSRHQLPGGMLGTGARSGHALVTCLLDAARWQPDTRFPQRTTRARGCPQRNGRRGAD